MPPTTDRSAADRSAIPGAHESRHIIGTRVDATSYESATRLILSWARAGTSSYVCATSVHGLIEANGHR